MDKDKRRILRKKILDLASKHPIRRSLMGDILRENGMEWKDIDEMVRSGELREISHDGEIFYVKRDGNRY